MTKENLINLIQSLLVVVGGFLIGDNFLGNEINQVLWLGIAGVVMTIVFFSGTLLQPGWPSSMYRPF